ncbi:MAG: DUF6264 family protein [Microbacteriaceae bacterium]
MSSEAGESVADQQPPAERPPVPQYGEYAPAGWVSPVTGQPSTAASAPTPTPAVPGYAAPQFLPGQAVPLNQLPQDPADQTAARPRRMWDLVLTIVILALGLLGAFGGIAYGFMLAPLAEMLVGDGVDADLAAFTAGGYVLIISHAVLYVIAAAVGVIMLTQRRIAFWVPLAIGILAAIIFWSVLTPLTSDPAIQQYLLDFMNNPQPLN